MAKGTKRGHKAPPRARRKAIASEKTGASSAKQQLADALAREAATADILKAIASSPTDVQPVFDAIVYSAKRLIGGFSALVSRVIGDQLHLVAYTPTDKSGDRVLEKSYPRAVSDVGVTGTAVRTGVVSNVGDTESDPNFPNELRLMARARGFRSILAVPMLRKGVAIGTINVTRREPGPFTVQQINLLKTFADQAVIAVENVRLFNETREALEQQTATAQILRVISGSPNDLRPVFDAILGSAVGLCDAHFGILNLYDGERFRSAAHRGSNPEFEKWVFERGAFKPEAFLRRIIDDRQPVHVSDIRESQAYRDGRPNIVKMVEVAGVRTFLAVPLLKEDGVIGNLAIYRPEVRPFTEKQIALVRTFADQAVIAIGNVRLFNETKEALERQTATAEILKVIASSPADVQPVFDAIVQSAARLFGRRAGLRLTEADGLRRRALSDPTAASLQSAELMPVDRESLLGRVVLEGRAMQLADTLAPDAPPYAKANAHALNFRANAIAPLIRDGKVLGAIGVNSPDPGALSDKQMALLATFADQAVIAIENVRLFHEIGDKSRLLEIANEERLARLKSFFSPQLAELLAAGKGEELLKTHRREITVQFFDLRGFTAFTGAAEPEEVMELLRDFHGALGRLVMEHEGTIERFAGDSVMVFFNDPLPVERPAERAVQSALAMMRAFDPIAALWKRRGYDLGLGAGIAQGFATLGAIGFEGRRDYAAIGPVTNLAARLCAEAKSGQILADRKTVGALEGIFAFDELGPIALKGFAQPVPAFALRRQPVPA